MRTLFVFLLLLPLLTIARTSKDRPVYFRVGAVYGLNLHASSTNNNFYYGHMKSGFGFNTAITIPLKGKLFVGFNIDIIEQRVDGHKVQEQAAILFDDNNHYTSLGKEIEVSSVAIYQIGPEFSYLIKTKHIDILPSFKTGLLMYSGADEIIDISRKKKNSNYSEKVHVQRTTNNGTGISTIFYGFGVRVNKRILKKFDITTAVYYVGAPSVTVGYKTKTSSFIGHNWESKPVEVKQSINTIQFQLGIHLRAWKSKKEAILTQ